MGEHPRKGKFKWGPGKGKRWGEKQRAKKLGPVSSSVGGVGGGPGPGPGPGPGGPMASGPGDRDKSNGPRPGQGEYEFNDDARKSAPGEKEQTAQPVVDLQDVFESLPELLQMFVLGLDNWARLLTGDPRYRVEVTFEPLSDREAKTLAKFCRPYVKAHFVTFIERHPGIAILCVPVFIFLFKVRIHARKKNKVPPGGPGPVVDAEFHY